MKWQNKVVGTLVIMVILSGCNFFEKQDNQQQSQKTYPPAPVDVVVAKTENLPIDFTYPARLQSPQSVVVVPKINGTIKEQKFKSGDFIKKGDTLFEIESDIYQANLDSAQAVYDGAEAEYKRVKSLFDKGASSQKSIDTAKSAKDNAKANLKLAKLNLSYTKITAPFSGIVGENLIDIGSYVSAGTTQLVRVTKIDELEARFYIADIQRLNQVKNLTNQKWSRAKDQKAILIIDGKEYEGKVVFIDSIIDQNSGTVLAKAKFKNTDNELFPGAVGHIKMYGFIQNNGIKIPQIAVLQDAIGAYVLVAKDNKVAKKPIKISYQTPEYAIISEGLEDGDLIITNNFRKIRVDAPVKVQNRSDVK